MMADVRRCSVRPSDGSLVYIFAPTSASAYRAQTPLHSIQVGTRWWRLVALNKGQNGRACHLREAVVGAHLVDILAEDDMLNGGDALSHAISACPLLSTLTMTSTSPAVAHS